MIWQLSDLQYARSNMDHAVVVLLAISMVAA